MTSSSEFWDALAPHHGAIENNYLDVTSLRRILTAIEQPVLVVGAGQGLLVEELRRRGLACDGVDLSSEMTRHAKLRRGLTLVEADAKAMPFGDKAYQTIIYATGVVNFTANEDVVAWVATEARVGYGQAWNKSAL